MTILGFNLAKTEYGLPLDNGGACLMIDGKVVALTQEERFTRIQYASGFTNSIKAVLKEGKIQADDIDLWVASSCLEPIRSSESVQSVLQGEGFNVVRKKILVCDHHLSHAHSAYDPSGFDEAIILVADGDGNSLDRIMVPDTANHERYWENSFEHTSYYIGRKDEIALLEGDSIGPGENSLGGAYRYFTYFCGFHGYKFAGKLMGLSAYGMTRNRFHDLKLFELLPNGQITCSLPDSNRLRSPDVVEHWFAERGISIKPRLPHEPIRPEYEDAAWLMQRELTDILVEKIRYLVTKTGITKLCIAGGVGLNAVTNRALLDRAGIKDIFIQPAAGDSGQSLGNALYGTCLLSPSVSRLRPISVYQGPTYAEAEILHAFEDKRDAIFVTKLTQEELIEHATEDLGNNKIVAWYQGRSEVGPRALGNRSILANPARSEMKSILNARVKHRESFRPFAPSVTEEAASQWFDLSITAPYMILNAPVKQPLRIPAVTHVDGSARVQTVSVEQNPLYHALLTRIGDKTGIPVLLNTSFNDNEAIVETPVDAIQTFLKTDIDSLYLQNYMITKKKPADCFNDYCERANHAKYVAVYGKTFMDKFEPTYQLAKSLGQRLIEEGFGLIHGGYSGVMEAACCGADEAIKTDPTKNTYYNIGVPVTYIDHELPRCSKLNLPPVNSVQERITLLTQLPDACLILPGGGFGTLAETIVLFHANQHAQKFGVGKIIPLIFFGPEWKMLIEHLRANMNLHKQSDGSAFTYFVDTEEEAIDILKNVQR